MVTSKDELAIMLHIRSKEHEFKVLIDFWNRFLELHKSIPLKESTYEDVQTRVSSRMAQLERSIESHQKLLKTPLKTN